MKINQRPDPELAGTFDVYITPSQSRPSLLHHTLVTGREGRYNVRCSCEGWMAHGKCWHVERVLEMLL